jgi:hypothetical protein
MFSPNIIDLFYIVEEYEYSHQDVSQAIYNIHVCVVNEVYLVISN